MDEVLIREKINEVNKILDERNSKARELDVAMVAAKLTKDNAEEVDIMQQKIKELKEIDDKIENIFSEINEMIDEFLQIKNPKEIPEISKYDDVEKRKIKEYREQLDSIPEGYLLEKEGYVESELTDDQILELNPPLSSDYYFEIDNINKKEYKKSITSPKIDLLKEKAKYINFSIKLLDMSDALLKPYSNYYIYTKNIPRIGEIENNKIIIKEKKLKRLKEYHNIGVQISKIKKWYKDKKIEDYTQKIEELKKYGR